MDLLSTFNETEYSTVAIKYSSASNSWEHCMVYVTQSQSSPLFSVLGGCRKPFVGTISLFWAITMAL